MVIEKEVAGFPGYTVGSDGYVFNHHHQMAEALDADGYPRVKLTKDGHRRWRKVATIVAETFLGPRPAGAIVRHLDGNPMNSDVSNLAWGTHKQNSADRDAHGRTRRGEAHHNAKLTTEQVAEIKRRLVSGEKQKAIAKDFGVIPAHVSRIKRGVSRAVS